MPDQIAALRDELNAIAERRDGSPAAIEKLLAGLVSDEAWYEENPYYDGMSEHGWNEPLWPVARSAISRVGEVAIDAVVARIRTGDAKMLERAAKLGEPIVAEAMLILERGPDPMRAAAHAVLGENLHLFGPVHALVNYLLAFDQIERFRDGLLRETWPKLITPEGRAAILDRWRDGGLREWIEARLSNDASRTRHLVVLLLAIPIDEALPLLRCALAAESPITAFEPLLVLDVERARTVLEIDEPTRIALRPFALQIARGGHAWETNHNLDRPRDHGLVALFAGDAEVWETLIRDVERRVGSRQDLWAPEWAAVRAHVRVDQVARLDRAIAAAIRSQLGAAGPGDPKPGYALGTLGALDRERMLAAIEAAGAEIAISKNKQCFEEIVAQLTAARRA